MAWLFGDSFDHYATADQPTKWTTTGGTITTGAKRNGTNGWHFPSGSKTLQSASGSTCIIGAAVRWAAFNTGLWLFAVTDGGAIQTLLVARNDGLLEVRNGGVGGTVLGTSAFVPTLGVFYYVELKVVLSNSVGSVQVKIDGTPILTLTGVDTQSTANATFNGISLSPASTVDGFDDLYVCDGTGSLNNDFLGDIRGEALLMSTDAVAAGSNAGFTPSTGTDHGALVDDATPNGDTDYNAASAPGTKDTYNFPNMSSTGAVVALQVLHYIRKSDQALKQFCPVVRHAGADYDGPTKTLAASYDYQLQVYETNPGTGVAFTAGNVNALQVGPKVVT